MPSRALCSRRSPYPGAPAVASARAMPSGRRRRWSRRRRRWPRRSPRRPSRRHNRSRPRLRLCRPRRGDGLRRRRPRGPFCRDDPIRATDARFVTASTNGAIEIIVTIVISGYPGAPEVPVAPARPSAPSVPAVPSSPEVAPPVAAQVMPAAPPTPPVPLPPPVPPGPPAPPAPTVGPAPPWPPAPPAPPFAPGGFMMPRAGTRPASKLDGVASITHRRHRRSNRCCHYRSSLDRTGDLQNRSRSPQHVVRRAALGVDSLTLR